MGSEKPEKKVYSFRFEQQLVSELKAFAQKENRSFSNFVETVLKAYVEKRNGRNSAYPKDA